LGSLAVWIVLIEPRVAVYPPNKGKMNKYVKDKERIDQITEIIANQQPVKEWVVIYWLAVAVGHLLEWVVRHEKIS